MLNEAAIHALDEAMKAYREDPSRENALVLRSSAAAWMRADATPASIGPFLGILEVIAEQHSYRWYDSWLMRPAVWYLRRKLPEERPGWNDYWMASWQLTGSVRALREIHWRAFHLKEWLNVGISAQWMVASYSQQDKQFASQMESFALTCVDCMEAKRKADQ